MALSSDSGMALFSHLKSLNARPTMTPEETKAFLLNWLSELGDVPSALREEGTIGDIMAAIEHQVIRNSKEAKPKEAKPKESVSK